MNAPTSATRFIGTPRNAGVLYVLSGLAVFGWFGGAVPWWLAIMALCFIGTVRKAVQDVRRYDAWAGDWQAMGRPATAPPRLGVLASFRKRQAAHGRFNVAIAVLSLVVLPVFIAAPGADDTIRHTLTAMWCGMALFLLWKTAAKLFRAIFRRAGTASAGVSKKSAPADVVEWILPRALSSPSRADAMRRLPEYSARVMAAK